MRPGLRHTHPGFSGLREKGKQHRVPRLRKGAETGLRACREALELSDSPRMAVKTATPAYFHSPVRDQSLQDLTSSFYKTCLPSVCRPSDQQWLRPATYRPEPGQTSATQVQKGSFAARFPLRYCCPNPPPELAPESASRNCIFVTIELKSRSASFPISRSPPLLQSMSEPEPPR